mgnify:FL=1
MSINIKLYAGNQISIFSNGDLDLRRNELKSNPMRALHMFLLYTKFDANMINKTKVIRQKPNFYF